MPDQLSQDLKSLQIDRSRRAPGGGSRRWVWLGVMALVAILAAAAIAFLPDKLGYSSLGAKPRQVEVAMVVRQSPSSDSVVLTAGGYVVPRRRADVAAKLGGGRGDN